MSNMLRIENLLFYLYISVNFELIGVGVNNIYMQSTSCLHTPLEDTI